MDNERYQIEEANELIDYIYESPTAFHAAKNAAAMLERHGFIELYEGEPWKIEKGGKYFTRKNQSALVAFIPGNGEIEDEGFRIVAAHTDSPGFRIKPNADMEVEGSYVKLNTEVYGGPILNTWMDRPLSLAGRVVLRGKDPFNPDIRFINVKRPLMVIPNLAIHMNRDVNAGVKLNRQKHLLPLLALADTFSRDKKYLNGIISEELSIDSQKILDFDLFLYEFEKGRVVGANNEFISSGRLDDLSMVYSGIKAISNSRVKDSTNVMVCFDNEEVGSTTKQGANSPMLLSVLERIALNLKKNRDEFYRSISKSFIISCDLGHALHPNYEEKSDPVNRPVINRGPIIKISASQSYTTDGVSGAVYREICRRAGIPVQIFVNRSDERGGSTIGPISSSHVNMTSLDMGIAILSMHSVRELGGVRDYLYALKSFREFYNL
ncbi:MAG: M18 family aminopeptidase [Clostridium sp.]|jgi:aspartyl aminopeptidase|uniref:M18 family aminopeptidase n=1 Tax=Clostridium sp. TaxID=1506 RepID=UPI0025C47059|nr:M18 family aminopeptidase [Clostridium sp.]MCH3964913.1 M18 family aminopeptidase [Clostridium sp.]MCI1716593.1 M18 family aminopeptidase [Clostridium sp.]MCI1800925.1 M18 family aminopeptidase [Clostridium sp.]MCI1814770.1 M18 family aminopeptidase [Clostridium sp.]MCI1871672.1 M18 family aminopeptidase [Clostridium sp.]